MKPQSRDRNAPASLIQTLDTTGAALSHRRIHRETRTADRADLMELLQGSIIPKLLASAQRQVKPVELFKTESNGLTTAEVAAFASLCLMKDETLATAFARQMAADGFEIKEVFDRLITPAARHLGVLWDRDLCDFEQVTIGLSRMQGIVVDLSQSCEAQDPPSSHNLQALFAALPDSQHTLGVMMVSELFRNEGWEVAMESGATESQLIAAVEGHWFDVIGLSISLGDNVELLRKLIQRLREHSKNSQVTVLVGGPLMSVVEGLDRLVGADAAAADANVAQKLAKALALSLRK